MKTSPFLPALLALAPFMAAAHAAPVVSAFDTTGFELRETRAFSISALPLSPLGQPLQGPNHVQNDPSYRVVPGGITLSSEARQPTAYHARQPRTELAEVHPWRVQDSAAALDTTVHIDRFPKGGSVILAELTADDDAMPVLRIQLDGDRLVLRGRIDDATQNGITLGTLDASHTARIALRIRTDGQVAVEANGTASTVHLQQKVLALPVMFRSGAHVTGDIGTTPDQVVVTLTGLGARHGAAQSGLRT